MAIIEHDFDFSIRDIDNKTELTNRAMLVLPQQHSLPF